MIRKLYKKKNYQAKCKSYQTKCKLYLIKNIFFCRYLGTMILKYYDVLFKIIGSGINLRFIKRIKTNWTRTKIDKLQSMETKIAF